MHLTVPVSAAVCDWKLAENRLLPDATTIQFFNAGLFATSITSKPVFAKPNLNKSPVYLQVGAALGHQAGRAAEGCASKRDQSGARYQGASCPILIKYYTN